MRLKTKILLALTFTIIIYSICWGSPLENSRNNVNSDHIVLGSAYSTGLKMLGVSDRDILISSLIVGAIKEMNDPFFDSADIVSNTVGVVLGLYTIKIVF